jgi:PTS system nitrogen regulatory IIA component
LYRLRTPQGAVSISENGSLFLQISRKKDGCYATNHYSVGNVWRRQYATNFQVRPAPASGSRKVFAFPACRMLEQEINPLEISMNTITKNLWPEDILLDVEVASKDQLFDEIGRLMEREHAMSRERVVAGLFRRERVGSTGLGEGIAIPHSRVDGLSSIRLAYLRLQTPLPYDAPDGRPVTDVLVILVPKQATEEHLWILADATQLFSDRKFREGLHSCRHALEVMKLFESRLL